MPGPRPLTTPPHTALGALALVLLLVAPSARAERPPVREAAAHRRPVAGPPPAWRGPDLTPSPLGRREPLPSFPEVTITLLLTSDLGGRFAAVRCRAAEEGPDLSALVGAIDAERARLAARGAPPPVVLDAGDLLGPAAVTRSLLALPGEGPATLAALLRRLGLDLVVLGNEELSLPPDALQRALAASDGALPYAAANVDCEPDRSPLCGLLERPDVRDRGYATIIRAGLRIAIVPVTRDDTPLLVDRRHVEGLTFRDPVASARAAARRARVDDRADLVIVLAHVNDGATVPRRALQLSRRVTEADLVLVNGFAFGQGGYDIREIRFGGGDGAARPPVMGQGGAERPALRVAIDMVYRGGRFQPRALVATSLPPAPRAPDVASVLDEVRRARCVDADVPIGDAVIDGTLDGEGMTAYVLQVMRFETRNELSVLNREAVALPSWPPFGGPITRDLLFHALPYGGRLVRFTLRGDALRKWLVATFPEAEGEHPGGLRFAGVERDGAGFEINGRDLDDARRYDIVTTRFLALGGDHFLAHLPEGVVFEDIPLDGLPPDATLRELVERWLAEGRWRVASGAGTVSLSTNFPSLWDELVWSLSADVGLDVQNTSTANSPGYEGESQLEKDPFFGLSVSAVLRADAQSRLHELTNLLDVSYAQARAGADGAFTESKDLTVFESAYAWLTLRNAVAGESPLCPVPLAKVRLETELTPSEDAAYHHAQLTGVIGVKWLFTDHVTLSAGYGVGGELASPDPLVSHGLDLTFEVKKMTLWELLDAPTTLQSRVDLFYTNTGGDDVLRGILGAELAFGVAGPLAVTVGFDGFLFERAGRGVAFAADVTAGLALQLGTHVQTF